MHDLRYALRALKRNPWYASAVTVVLAASMALGTVAFALVDGVLFKPLPFERPAELFVVHARAISQVQAPPVSFRQIQAWMDAIPELTFSGVTALPYSVVLGPGQEYWMAAVDERFFEVTGQVPMIGGFRPEDFLWNFETVEAGGIWQPQIISYHLWRRIYGGDPAVIGRTFVSRETDGRTFGRRIVGVLPRDFAFPIDGGGPQPDALVPVSHALQRTAEQRFQAIVRIPGATDLPRIQEQLRAATTAFGPAHQMLDKTPASAPAQAPSDLHLMPIRDHLASDERRAFWIVAGGAVLLLLLACVNVAGLAAARNMQRRRELAVRRALGASAWRLVRGLAAEVSVLALLATGVALLVARPLLIGMTALLPPTITLLKTPELDARVFAMAAALLIPTVVAVSFWPARVIWRVQADAASNPLSGSATMPGRRSHSAIIAAQVTLGFVLVTAGGLSVASFAAAWRMDAGFERDRMILVEAFVTRERSPDDAVEQLTAARERLAPVGGVEEVAVSSIQPLFGRRSAAWSNYVPVGGTARPDAVAMRKVSSNYFGVMRLDLVRGRWPVAGEWGSGQGVALVSATAARTLWPDRDAIGQLLVRHRPTRQPEAPFLVIGVVQDARYAALDTEPMADIYLPGPIERDVTGVYFHARTSRAAADVLPGAVAALGSGLRLEQAATHADALFAAVKHRALPAWVFGLLAATAMLVIVVGILGLLTMSIAQRTRELGIRIALGARAATLVRLLVGEQLAPVAAGLAAGGLISAWAVQYLRSHLYGIHPYEPSVWSAIVATIAAVALAGVLLPALRATRVDPIEALRSE